MDLKWFQNDSKSGPEAPGARNGTPNGSMDPKVDPKCFQNWYQNGVRKGLKFGLVFKLFFGSGSKMDPEWGRLEFPILLFAQDVRHELFSSTSPWLCELVEVV